MMVIFAGAGASAAVDAARYPTTRGFFERLPESIAGDSRFRWILQYLREVHERDEPDIEEVLWTLSELRSGLESTQDPKTIFGWALQGNRLIGLAGQSGNLSPALTNAVVSLRGPFESLVARVNEQVFQFYGAEPETARLGKTWGPLLEYAIGEDPEVEVFTTNYDVVIESSLRQLQEAGLRVLDGRVRKNVFETLDLMAWSDQPKGTYLRFTKLHGSVDWAKEAESETIYVGTPGFRGDLKKHVAVFPGHKGSPDSEPFRSFHEHLARCLTKAGKVLFVGFAFRDDYINELIERYVSSDCQLVAIDPSPLSSFPLPEDRLARVPMGFGRRAVRSINKALSGEEVLPAGPSEQADSAAEANIS